jgi:hypothetical protein
MDGVTGGRNGHERLNLVPARSADRPHRETLSAWDFPHGEFNGGLPIHKVFTLGTEHRPAHARAKALLVYFGLEVGFHGIKTPEQRRRL